MKYSIRDLNDGEMLSISGQWLGTQREQLVSIAEVVPFTEQLTDRHEALRSASGGGPDSESALAKSAHQLDDRHDHLGRAGRYYILARAHYLLGKENPDPDGAAALLQASDALYPSQLDMVNASYLDESGTAQQMATQATTTLKSLLDTIAVEPDMSATDLFVQLGQVGEQLGEVTRARIEASSSDAAATVTPAELRRRMRAWVEIADTILRALNVSKAPPATIEAIRQPLIEAATKATARRRARRKKPQEPASEG